MSVYVSLAAPRDQFRLILSSFQQAADLPFADVLSGEESEQGSNKVSGTFVKGS